MDPSSSEELKKWAFNEWLVVITRFYKIMVKKREVLSKCPVIQYRVWIFTAGYGLAHVELNLPGVMTCNCRNREALIVSWLKKIT